MYNEAIFQFVQWFATEPEVELQARLALILSFSFDRLVLVRAIHNVLKT